MQQKLSALCVELLVSRLSEGHSASDRTHAAGELDGAGLNELSPLGKALASRIVRYANEELQRMLAE